jgi:hypothetical protein
METAPTLKKREKITEEQKFAVSQSSDTFIIPLEVQSFCKINLKITTGFLIKMDLNPMIP